MVNRELVPHDAVGYWCCSMPLTPQKPNKKSSYPGTGKTSFQQYEESTIDAWDDGDDDLLAKLKLDSSMIQSTAKQVIHSHSSSKPLKENTPSSSKADGNYAVCCHNILHHHVHM